jgi:NADH:ubiquinone oxidoreductase subunit 4 (subunit M)
MNLITIKTFLITITTFLPLAGAVVLLLSSALASRDAGKESLDNRYRWIALIVTTVTFFASVYIIAEFDRSIAAP